MKGKRGKRSLEKDLQELESTDPDVRRAANSYRDMVQRVTSRGPGLSREEIREIYGDQDARPDVDE